MDEPKSLDSLFTEKIFRIPDYQRGYAWQREQLKDFWEDLINLSDGRSHYTGVLTLKLLPAAEIPENAKEYWLVDDHSYKVYHIVDGQQRLTTFVIFLQAFVDLCKSLPEFVGKPAREIFITDSLNVEELQIKFLFKTKPTGDQFRTYKFGYTTDNPSYEYLRYKILGEPGAGSIQETFYTLNLSNAKNYFSEQLRGLHQQEGLIGLQNVYKKLTKRFLFNEYVIRDEFDVFVAFETMNNRGKKLSDLELLKNRLIYLTTLYGDDELDLAERDSLRTTINNAWREVYYQLGRNTAIDRESFDERKKTLLEERLGCEAQLADLRSNPNGRLQRLERFVELVKSAYLLYENGNREEKREVLQTALSNRVVYGKEFDFMLVSSLSAVADTGGAKSGDPLFKRERTFWERHLSELVDSTLA